MQRRQRQRRRRANKKSDLRLPITVRQAQKLVESEEWQTLAIKTIRREVMKDEDYYYSSRFTTTAIAEVQNLLARLASKDPNQVLIDVSGKSAVSDPEKSDSPEYAPKGTDEVADQSENPSNDSTVHGGDNASQEVEDGQSQGGNNDSLDNTAQLQDAGTDEGNQGQGSGDSQDGGSHSDRSDRNAPQSYSCETGSSTSQGNESGGKSQAPTSQEAESSESPNSELGEGAATSPMSDTERTIDAAVNDDSVPRDEQVNQTDSPNRSHTSVSAKAEDNFNSDRQAETDGEQPGTEGRPQKDDDSPEFSLGESDEQDCQDDLANSSEKASDDIPAHQKKWGKSFGKAEKGKLSQSANHNTGEATASLKQAGISPKLLKLCRQRLAALVGDSSQQHSPRRDYQEFCVRFKTYRNPQPARKEEEGRPVILLLADISGSCASFSEESVKVAKAASKLGVQGADIIVISHYNGQPYEMEVNGKTIAVDSIEPSKVKNLADNGAEWNNSSGWYETLLQRYNITVAIALGDWDGSLEYAYIAQHPQIEKFIWLDNAHCSSRGTVQDRTRLALENYKKYSGVKIPVLRQKLIYKDGCKDAIAFIDNIKV